MVMKIWRNFRGDQETWVLNYNPELKKKDKGFQPDLQGSQDSSWLFFWMSQEKRWQWLYFCSLRTVKPKPSLFPPGLSNLISFYSFCSSYCFLFSWNFPPSLPLLKLLRSNCFEHPSFCSVKSNLNASILHEIFLDFSSPSKYSSAMECVTQMIICQVLSLSVQLNVWFPHLTSFRASL